MYDEGDHLEVPNSASQLKVKFVWNLSFFLLVLLGMLILCLCYKHRNTCLNGVKFVRVITRSKVCPCYNTDKFHHSFTDEDSEDWVLEEPILKHSSIMSMSHFPKTTMYLN